MSLCVRECLTDWLTQWLTDWMNEWMNENERTDGCVDEWMNEAVKQSWINQWMIQSMNQWIFLKNQYQMLPQSVYIYNIYNPEKWWRLKWICIDKGREVAVT